jgi:DNA-binding MarR family transcriptional regulator
MIVDNSTKTLQSQRCVFNECPAMPKMPAVPHPMQSLPLKQRFTHRFSMITRTLAQQMLLHVGREFGLNLAEYRILNVLADRDSSSIRDIAALTQLDKSHVTRALADLIKRGQATQIVDPQDRRLRMVELTPAGRAMVAAMLPFSIERQRRLERCLTASELRVLWKALSALSDEAERLLAEEEEKDIRHKLAAKLAKQIASKSARKLRRLPHP